jgi:hypothetical protein
VWASLSILAPRAHALGTERFLALSTGGWLEDKIKADHAANIVHSGRIYTNLFLICQRETQSRENHLGESLHEFTFFFCWSEFFSCKVKALLSNCDVHMVLTDLAF